MQSNTHMGLNRTGAKMSPIDVSSMEAFAQANPVSDSDDSFTALREEAIAEAERIGSVPVPGTLKGMIETGMALIKSDNPALLIDKLGERLAFERTGTRLYDALLIKCSQLMTPEDPRLLELQRIRGDEAAHFLLLVEALESLGADPTAQTPCADVAGAMSLGLLQTVSDPRTDLPQCLNAILVAELTDNSGWELLIKIAQRSGHDELASRLRHASVQEEEHLLTIKQMLELAVLQAAT